MSKRSGVRHIKDDIWEYNYYPYPKAKRKWVRIKASSKKEAETKKAIAVGGNVVIDDTKSFAEVRVALELKLKADNLSPKTQSNYLFKWDNFIAFLSKHYPNVKSLNQLTREIMERYKQWIVVDKGRVTGWRDELTKIRTITRKLIDIGLCDKRVYDILLLQKKPKAQKKLYKDITMQQLKDLLNYIEPDRPDYYGIALIIMQYGIRRGQAVSVKRENVKTGEFGRPIEFRWDPVDTKTDIPHVLPITDPKLANVIHKYMTDGRKTIWLFPNRNNGKHHANHFTTYISKVSKKVLGIHLSPHDFRHSYITNRRKEGHTDEDIMAITGHTDVDSLAIYTHRTTDGTKRVLDSSKVLD